MMHHAPSPKGKGSERSDKDGRDSYTILAHTLSVNAVAEKLTTDCNSGLDQNEAARRLKEYGRNELGDTGSASAAKVLLAQIANAMTLVLILAMAVSFGIRSWIEGGVVAFVLLLNITVGFFQEYSAEKTMDSLRTLGSPSARIIREGQQSTIPSGEVVQGDIVEIKVGDTVPADIRLYDVVNLETDEALLTGESLAVVKNSGDVFTEQTGPGDRLNVAFSSSTVTKGRAKGIVFATGANTEIGQIAAQLRAKESKVRQPKQDADGNAKRRHHIQAYVLTVSDAIGAFLGLNTGTPLQKRLSKLAVLLFGIAVVCAIIVLAANQFSGRQEVVIYAVATGLSMIPASLVVVLTITMAAGTKTMVKRNVIVRNLKSLEALGGVTDICSDKTGTLTQGKMVARIAWIPGLGAYKVEDTSEPSNPTAGTVYLNREASDELKSNIIIEKGEHIEIPANSDSDASLQRFMRVAALANIAEVKQKKDGLWEARGDPTEIAIQVFASRFKMNRHTLMNESSEWEQISEYPFDSDVKRMSVIMTQANNESFVFTKGAVERVLSICKWYKDETIDQPRNIDEFEARILQNMEVMAAQGLRVLALASKSIELGGRIPGTDEREDIERDLTFCGLIGLYDPPRNESADAVRACHEAGIEVHMLTGDHFGTAKAIAKEVGILPDQSQLDRMAKDTVDALVMTAADFDGMSDEEVDRLNILPLVIARCAPSTKVRMIEALHRRGRFCAMTGDGVNDSPSLKRADVGISMGKSGSDVAKEASDLVLTDDNFASIVAAIEEGRRIFDNIQKFVLHVLAENVSQALVLLVGLAFKDRTGLSVFPLAPVQVVWIIMATSGLPDMGLGFERAITGIMKRPPHAMKVGIFTKEFMVDMVVYGVWIAALCLSSFALVVFGFGTGELGENCNETYSEPCDLVFRARATTFACLTWFALFLAWEMIDLRRSFFNLRSSDRSIFSQFFVNLWSNQFLFWAVVAGFATLFPVIYIPVINKAVFKHAPISWEWSIVFISAGLFFAGVEVWKFGKRVFFRRRLHKQQMSRVNKDGIFARYMLSEHKETV